MANKIIISESQYERLLQRLDETPFDVMVDETMSVGDRVNVFHENGKNSFRVKQVTPTGITMIGDDENDSATKFYDYFMNEHSLNNNNLELKKVDNRDKEKLDNISKWDTIHFNGVKNIEVIRDRKRVDRLDPIGTEPEQGPEQGDQQEPEALKNQRNFKLPEIIVDIATKLGVGTRLELVTENGQEINLCCFERIGKQPTIFTLEPDETTKSNMAELTQYEKFYLTLYNYPGLPQRDNNKNIYINDNDGINMALKVNPSKQSETVIIENITYYNFSNCVSDEEPNEPEEEKPEETPPTEPETPPIEPEETPPNPEEMNPEEGKTLADSGYNYDEMYNTIMSDRDMQNAFFSQPTLWRSFVDSLRGKKPANRGIITALKYMSRFAKKMLNKKIGPGFNESGNKNVYFNPVYTYEVPYTLTEQKDENGKVIPQQEQVYQFTKDSAKLKSGKIRNFMVEPNDGLAITHRMTDINGNEINDSDGTTPLYLYIIVNGKTKTKDIKECNLIINPDKKSPKGNAMGKYDRIAEVEFFKSEGYNPNEVEDNQETRINKTK